MNVDDLTYATPAIWAKLTLRLCGALLLGALGILVVKFAVYATGTLGGSSPATVYWWGNTAVGLWLLCIVFAIVDAVEKFNAAAKKHQDEQHSQVFFDGDLEHD